MDVDGLRKELEEHLKKNPDESAPSGFRDRFESILEQMKADDGITDDEWHVQLQRIRDEAEAAHTCLGDQSDVPDNDFRTEPPGGGDSPPVDQDLDDRGPTDPPDPGSGGPVADSEGEVSAGFLRRLALPLGIAAIALAAAYFAFRS